MVDRIFHYLSGLTVRGEGWICRMYYRGCYWSLQRGENERKKRQ